MTAQETTTQRLTIKDVARHIGVSTATISNAFHRPDQLSVQLRERVLSACTHLGYSPASSSARRRYSTGRKGIVGVLLSDCLSHNLNDRSANQFLTGLSEVLDNAQLGILMLSARDIESLYQLRQHAALVEGFIAYGRIDNEHCQENLANLVSTLITVDCSFEGHGNIRCDDFGAAKNIALHALKHHPRHVAVLGHRLIDSRHVCRVYNPGELLDTTASVSAQRLLGYQAAFNAANLELPQDRIWHIPVNAVSCAEMAVREALLSHPRPDLLLCMSDSIAQAALNEARNLGIRVPDELHIVGFDALNEYPQDQPSITTVLQDNIEKGRQAARSFLAPDAATQVILPSRILIGDSCPLPPGEEFMLCRTGH